MRNPWKPWIGLCALSFFWSALHAESAAITEQRAAAVISALKATLAKDGLPSLSVAVGYKGSVWSAAAGAADLENAVPATSQTLYRTASISKWMTATAALKLVEQGKLDLDAPVQRYCAQFPEKPWPITSRFLISHLSGIRHYHGANGEPRTTEEQRRTLDELTRHEQSTRYTRYTDVIAPLDAFKDDPLIFQPGTRVMYSSLGFRVLACVLEGAAQRPYRTLMRELVFTPAGMAATTEDDSLAIVPHRVSGYAKDNGSLVRAQFRDVSENLPAGGHLATPLDLVRFAIAFNDGHLVQPRTRDLMIARPKLIDGTSVPAMPPFFGFGTDAYYGMGVFVSSVAGDRFVMHPGSQNGTSTELLLVPKTNVAVAVMTNMNGWNGAHQLATQIAEIVGD